jgi:hypothetical protein
MPTSQATNGTATVTKHECTLVTDATPTVDGGSAASSDVTMVVPAHWDCGHAVGDTVVVAATSAGSLALCLVEPLIASLKPFDPPSRNATAAQLVGSLEDGMPCGGAGHGVWEGGICAGHCSAYSTCSSCAHTRGCGWCTITAACTAVADMAVACQNLTAAAASEDVTNVDDDVADTEAELTPADFGVISEGASCHVMRGTGGITRELYFNVDTRWSIDGLKNFGFFQQHNPTEHDILTRCAHACIALLLNARVFWHITYLQAVRTCIYYSPTQILFM